MEIMLILVGGLVFVVAGAARWLRNKLRGKYALMVKASSLHCLFCRVFILTLLSLHKSSVAGEDISFSGVRSGKDNLNRIASIMVDKKVVCFSRFVIEVPKSAQVVFGRMTVDAEIDRYEGMGQDVGKIIDDEIKRNREKASIFNKGGEIDKMAEKPIETYDKRLRHLISISGLNRYSVRSFLVLEKDAYVLRTSGIFEKQVGQILRENEVVASFFRGRQESEIPDEAGVCIDGAFTTQNPTFENIEMGVRLAEFPDVHLSISIIGQKSYVEPQEMFLKRHAEALASGREAGFGEFIDQLKYLRKTSRKVNDWSGDEVLIKFPPWKEQKEGHQFAFWSAGKINDPFHPKVDIKLDTGVKGNAARGVSASLTDEEAVVLWDRLLKSIRVRPVNAGKKQSNSLHTVPEIVIRTQQGTGSSCPSSG